MAAYFKETIYVAAEYSPLRAFPVAQAKLSEAPSATAPGSIGGLGATPSVSANGSRNGIIWTISSDASGSLRAYDSGSLNLLYDSSLQPDDMLSYFLEFAAPTIADGKVFVEGYYRVLVFGEKQADPPAITSITNAASFDPKALAPGSLISLFGSGLSPITATASAIPLPISLADVSVSVNGIPAPLLFVSAGQINAQIPFEVEPGPATVVVRVGGVYSAPANILVLAAAPGIFANSQGQAAVLNADGTLNSPLKPAAVGSHVSLFCTGQGALSVPIEDGEAPPLGKLVTTVAHVSVAVATLPASVGFAGLAPQYAGLAQINFKVPPLPPGSYTVTVSIGGVASNSAQLSISAP
jgi:uncharacterized protein (TIGR03437 family)